MSNNKNEKTQLYPSKFRRLTSKSHALIIHSAWKKDRDEYINSEEFKTLYGELSKLLLDYNINIETIKWQFLTGKKRQP